MAFDRCLIKDYLLTYLLTVRHQFTLPDHGYGLLHRAVCTCLRFTFRWLAAIHKRMATLCGWLLNQTVYIVLISALFRIILVLYVRYTVSGKK